jgi:hypothetical protein
MKETVCLERVSLSDQCEMRYYQRVSLFIEMRDVPLVRASLILGKERSRY